MSTVHTVPPLEYVVPVAVGLALVALFFVLQHRGVALWVVNHHHGFWIIGVHVAFVAFETAVLAYFAVQMRRTDETSQAVFDAASRLATGDLHVELPGDGAARN